MSPSNKTKKKPAKKPKFQVLGNDPFVRHAPVRAEPQPHAQTPSAYELDGAVAHASSPTISADPQPHLGAPRGQELDGPTAHPASPDAIETSARPEPREHAAAFSTSAGQALKSAYRALRLFRHHERDSLGKDAPFSASLRPLGEYLFEKYWRVKIEGADHVPEAPFVLVANHGGGLPLDGPVLHLALQREHPSLKDARWLVEDQVIQMPVLGSLVSRLGAVRATPENALKVLAEKHPLIVFPEGFGGLSKPFSERYQLRRFGRGGYLKIALRAGVPLVPAAIVGSEETTSILAQLPRVIPGLQLLPLASLPLPAKWHIRFGAPLTLEGAPDHAEDNTSWLEERNQMVRSQIAGMLAQMREQRERVF